MNRTYRICWIREATSIYNVMGLMVRGSRKCRMRELGGEIFRRFVAASSLEIRGVTVGRVLMRKKGERSKPG
jgi:hypothetical protein